MPAKEAAKIFEEYFKAFNAQDERAMREKLNFPFSWIINNRVRYVGEASQFVAPTKELIETEEWHRSEVDFFEPVQAWPEKVHFTLAYSRFKADGTKYVTHEALWIVTKVKGKWGVQCMSLHIPK